MRDGNLIVHIAGMEGEVITQSRQRSIPGVWLQAMTTGHDGSMSTVHANSPRDALYRVENMVMMANLSLPLRAIRMLKRKASPYGDQGRSAPRC
jgi:type IV secretory pathway ATPase VirB11/archaellum biosynthesis ATPase